MAFLGGARELGETPQKNLTHPALWGIIKIDKGLKMADPYPKQSYGGIFIGYNIRGTIGGDVTFRVRRGNGHYGSINRHVYQDRFTRVTPSSVNNTESEPYRALLRAAIIHWQFALTAAEKAAYNRRASRRLRMSGYNLFIREAMLGKVPMYVDRGDPAAYDYAKEDLSKDGAWHDLDLSGIVPAGAKAVFIIGHVQGAGADWAIMFRKKGNTNEINHGGMETLRANVERHRSSTVALSTARVIQYKADNQAWTTLDLCVRGWWM